MWNVCKKNKIEALAITSIFILSGPAIAWWDSAPNHGIFIDVNSNQEKYNDGDTASISGDFKWLDAHNDNQSPLPKGILDKLEIDKLSQTNAELTVLTSTLTEANTGLTSRIRALESELRKEWAKPPITIRAHLTPIEERAALILIAQIGRGSHQYYADNPGSDPYFAGGRLVDGRNETEHHRYWVDNYTRMIESWK